MKTFVERHASKILGTLSCFDRVVITGTLPDICHTEAMAAYLGAKGIRLFDYPQFAMGFREEIRAHAEELAHQNGLTIEFIRRKNFRKEKRVKAIVAERGDHPGLVHIFSAMEPCPSFRAWHDKVSGKTMLKRTDAKCLHYYFYLIDPELGLCYLRVPTWAPFRLQFYFNGHNQLALKLKEAGMAYTLLDNAFVQIADFARAQALADDLDIGVLHRRLDRIATQYCPVTKHFPSAYHWSLMQVEYATDVVFRRQAGGQLPSGQFGANAAWWAITVLAYNLNALMKRLAMPQGWAPKRLKAIRFGFINVAARVVTHARKLIIRLSQSHPAYNLLLEVRRRIHAFWHERALPAAVLGEPDPLLEADLERRVRVETGQGIGVTPAAELGVPDRYGRLLRQDRRDLLVLDLNVELPRL